MHPLGRVLTALGTEGSPQIHLFYAMDPFCSLVKPRGPFLEKYFKTQKIKHRRLQRKLIILKQNYQNEKNKSDVVIYGILYHHIKKPLYLRAEMTLRFFSCL